MRRKIRQWFTEHPKATNLAFSLLFGYTILAEYGISPQVHSGGATGP
ncbi:hypothetical protein [Halomicrococcus sp. NG-SE-24]